LASGFKCYFRFGSLGGPPLLKFVMVVLLVVWVLGFLTHHTLGGFLHALLVLAAVLWLINVVRGGNP